MVALSAMSSFYGNYSEAEPVGGSLAHAAAMDYCSQGSSIQPKKVRPFLFREALSLCSVQRK
jgi:hypothetical protein